MGYVKQYDKRSGITYIYENYPYWDKERKQHRAVRKLVGRLDPETGNIVPTDGRCRRGKKAEEADGRISDVVQAAQIEYYEKRHASDVLLIECLQRDKADLQQRYDVLATSLEAVQAGNNAHLAEQYIEATRQHNEDVITLRRLQNEVIRLSNELNQANQQLGRLKNQQNRAEQSGEAK